MKLQRHPCRLVKQTIKQLPVQREQLKHECANVQLKMLSKNTNEGVHLIVKLPAISLQACKFTKNELLHTHFSRILARF